LSIVGGDQSLFNIISAAFKFFSREGFFMVIWRVPDLELALSLSHGAREHQRVSDGYSLQDNFFCSFSKAVMSDLLLFFSRLEIIGQLKISIIVSWHILNNKEKFPLITVCITKQRSRSYCSRSPRFKF
jgi:hypothetical protein